MHVFYFFFQRQGIEQNLGIGKINEFEQHLVENAIPELKKNIEKGLQFVKNN